MATIKNRTSNVRPWTITPQDIADFKRAMELQGDGPGLQRSIELYSDPVHCDEYREIGERLWRSFDCLLWIDNILHIEEWRPPADHDLPEYERAYAIRKALGEAAGRPLMRPTKDGLRESRERPKLLPAAATAPRQMASHGRGRERGISSNWSNPCGPSAEALS